jgi:flavin reductase (DIM6/NTAB) family NADH-FMN oxidoreductase RutF
MQVELNTLKPGHIYGLMTQVLIPRPIAWVLSDNGDGGLNLAPFSFFTGISSKPPLLMLAIGKRPDGSGKDTLNNIEKRDHFVVHIPAVSQKEAVEASAEPLPAGESEVTKLGLELTEFSDFTLPRLKSSQLAMACSCHQIIRLDGVAQSMVIGKIKTVYMADEIVQVADNGKMTVSALDVDPLSRLGPTEYAGLGKTFMSK